jgi:RNA polymerase sigma factor (sigma-70 family)
LRIRSNKDVGGQTNCPFSHRPAVNSENMNSDIELLDAYAESRSEDAFGELVTRHVDFIYSAAMRQLRNAHLAEEATQAAFIALSRKAGRLQRRTVIAGWLYRAVHFAALNLQRSEARRKHWEKEAATMGNPGEDALTNPEAFKETALPQVDEALAELGETDRTALVLRFLQQKSLRDVGETMGTSEEAAKKRVSRALEKLRGLLVRRGVVVPAAALAIGLSQLPVFAAPAVLRASLTALGLETAIPAATLASAILARMLLFRTKLIAACGGVVVLCAGIFALWPGRSTANNAPTNVAATSGITIKLTSVMVDDQEKALRFYTNVLGFIKKRDVPTGGERWLTVVSPEGQDEMEMLLEPMGFAPARIFQQALHEAGIPWTGFGVDNIQKVYERLTQLGVNFTTRPTNTGPATIAIFDDTCGNLIQLFQPTAASNINSSTKNTTNKTSMKIKLTSVMVKDQDKALKFYTETLGFVKKHDMPAGEGRWLTVVSAQEPEGPELLLEPMGFPPAKVFQEALHKAGIPWTGFAVENTQKEYERLKKLGVSFTMEPTQMGPTTIAVFDDTCGNLIQLFQK